LASRLLKRQVALDEVWPWLRDENVETLFVEPILERAQPLIVHTRHYQQLLRRRYGFEAELTTFPPNMNFDRDSLTDEARRDARYRLGIPPNVFAVSTFGGVARNKGAFECINAIEHLRSWGVPAELYFVGRVEPQMRDEAEGAARNCGIEAQIHFESDYVELGRYRDFLVGSDAGIQLRTYGFGQPSAALADCISAGLPSVATAELAESCDSPSYIQRIPDTVSALQLAQKVTEIWESSYCTRDRCDERDLYCRIHSFEYYARRLSEILGLE
jgi:glycosyltransferase involved in cell wall biosynthesis